MMMTTMVLIKVLTLEQNDKIAILLWSLFWTVSAVSSSTILMNWKAGIFIIVNFGFSTILGKLMTPSSVYEHLEENQRGLYILQSK